MLEEKEDCYKFKAEKCDRGICIGDCDKCEKSDEEKEKKSSINS